MKIFSAAQIHACDAYTIHARGITSLALMEQAAIGCMEWIAAHLPKDTLFVVVCGCGNNGGDGLAVTRLLHHAGYGVKAFLLRFSETLSPDCAANLEKLQKDHPDLIEILQPETFITDIPANIIVIDAILGTGLSRPVEGWVAKFINQLNSLPNRRIAVDIPSGMPADNIPDKDAVVMQVSDTLSFQFYKRTFLHPETGVYAGKIHLIDLGLEQTFIKGTHTQYHTIDHEKVKSMYRPRTPFSHKGTYGHALIIGGSYGKIGAITLSAKAALRAGAGLVTALLPQCGYEVVQTAVPEVMCLTSGEKHIGEIADWKKNQAIGIGPGLDTNTVTVKAFADFIDECKQPVVIDADALNILAKHNELLARIPPGSVLTPHPKEFSRIFGESVNSMMELEHARTQAMRYNIFIVLKGHHTAVVTPEGECWYNMTGNAGMATGGAGDVLTGIITGLIAQGYDGGDAAMLGVYLHGLAGDKAAEKSSMEAMIAGDIIDNLGHAFASLKNLTS
ncbi:MAG: NAD(P)H-hydrate dehydratase [Taibaiella sp.]|nr:NAD(P)H-hydrate dehydratase [Taibaiella sp.]